MRGEESGGLFDEARKERHKMMKPGFVFLRFLGSKGAEGGKSAAV